jgi:hypothetical protein
MRWRKYLQAAHGPMLEAADACELTGPSRPVALDLPRVRNAVCPRFGVGVVVDHFHARHLAHPQSTRSSPHSRPLGTGTAAAAAGLCGRLSEPHGCEDASTLGGVEPV